MSGGGTLLSMISGPSTGLTETIGLADYIQSREFAKQLDERHHLRALYSKPRLDLLNWLWPNANDEALYQFFTKMTVITVDRDADIIEVDVRSFDPRSAQEIANSVRELATAFVGDLSRQMHEESVRSARADVVAAEADVQKARVAVAQFRTSAAVVDPAVNTASDMSRVTAMQAQLDSAKAALASLISYTRSDAPQVQQYKAQIASLEKQVAATQAQVAGDTVQVPRQPKIHTEAQKVTVYEILSVQRDYAEKRLVAAMAAYDSAISLADQRDRFVVTVVKPNLPSKSTVPNRPLDFLLVMLFGIASYAIITLTLAAIRDHRGI